MADNTTVIGHAARVRGRLTGEVSVSVHGFVEGEITVEGDVTVESSGIVDATIRGRRLVIRGAVRGDLVGGESVGLAEGARVVGDIRAPRVAIAQGALARGAVEAGGEGEASAVGARSQSAARTAASPASRGAPLPAKVVASSPVVRATAKLEVAAPVPIGPATSSAEAKPSHAPARRPPPPVVPILKKAKGQVLKKKER
ncbi:MAG: polymer-forming cytoskeletal protein [Polyangiaceae bacterium]|jgi:cytoskeletal protein CcmA (bactofilin family)